MLLREIRDFLFLYHVISAFCTSTSLLISSENNMKITTETPMQCATQRHAFFQPPGAWRQPNRNVRRRGVRRRGAKDPRSTRHRGRKDTPRKRPKSPWKARPIRWCGCSNMFHLDGAEYGWIISRHGEKCRKNKHQPIAWMVYCIRNGCKPQGQHVFAQSGPQIDMAIFRWLFVPTFH